MIGMIATKSHVVFFLLLLIIVLLPCGIVRGAHEREYMIELRFDGSAMWVIEQRFLLETEDEKMMFEQYADWKYFKTYFVENVNTLLDTARLKTGRGNMTVENFKMTVGLSGSYKVVKYQFNWIEFLESKGSKIIIGDVFRVDGPFLLGDGTLAITYPPGYAVETLSPKPDVESDRTLVWYGVTNFETGEPRVILREKTQNPMNALKENATIIISLINLVGMSIASLWFFKFKRREKREVAGAVPRVPTVAFEIEDDEEKVVTLLESSGGRLYQSTIVDQLEFSRSKTSQLLTSMENRGKIRREKKGREKVVTLIDEAKG